ncbi:MAG: type II toxin-antitoxin system Phd/YefM family antitoxin [Thermoanaerobaculia bacterium]
MVDHLVWVGQAMSEQVNIYDAKTRLSQLVDRAEAGEEIIIARGGRPAARLVAFRQASVERKPGRMRGRIRLSRDFDAPLPANLFDGEE